MDIRSVDFDRTGRHMVTSDRNGVIRFWNIGEPAPALTWSVGDRTPAFASISPDGSSVATVAIGDRRPRLWRISGDGGEDGAVRTIEVHVPWQASHRAGISSITFDPEGERLVTTSFGGVAAVWNIADGRLYKPSSTVEAASLMLASAPTAAALSQRAGTGMRDLESLRADGAPRLRIAVCCRG
ncbi:MAG: WD40 repeat domain-containing protein [Defluviicoccus sp.]|nr:MAG: WD40 repeat domain-containing protein [Defluviicoccus sp.]